MLRVLEDVSPKASIPQISEIINPFSLYNNQNSEEGNFGIFRTNATPIVAALALADSRDISGVLH
jgi:hypothetical protein